MTSNQALSFVRQTGVVLESAQGHGPSIAEMIAGEPIRGSWWSHPKSHEIYSITQALRKTPEILVCTLIDQKITFVHRRLWPALVRVSDQIPRERLALIREVHTPTGAHRREEVTFPEWVPHDVMEMSQGLSEGDALSQLKDWINNVT